MSKSKEDFIIKVMNAGFDHAGKAFSTVVGLPVNISSQHLIIAKHNFKALNLQHEHKGSYVLVTNIVGAFSGKSYLMLNDKAANKIFNTVCKKEPVHEAFKDSLLLELDNIISASVITTLANALHVEAFGDVPLLKKLPSGNFTDYLKSEFGEESSPIAILTNVNFQIEDQDRVGLEFVWKLNTNILDLISEERLSLSLKC